LAVPPAPATVLLKDASLTATNTPDPLYFTPVVGNITTSKGTSTGADSTIILKAGVTKVRIYMWLEGQDYDCGDTASGMDVTWDLVFNATKVNP